MNFKPDLTRPNLRRNCLDSDSCDTAGNSVAALHSCNGKNAGVLTIRAVQHPELQGGVISVGCLNLYFSAIS